MPRERGKTTPSKLSTTISKIQLVPNAANKESIAAFHTYLMGNDLSVHHINNNLKAAISYAQYLGPEKSFHDILSKEEVISYLDTKRKSADHDPEMKWITTWNHYLNRLRFFFRWFDNRYVMKAPEPMTESEWETPEIVRIKSKKSKRVSPYSESDIWDLEELKTLIKYEPFKRNKAAIALMWDLNARNHEVTLLKIKHIRLKERYGEGEIPHQAKTGSGPILLTFSFPYVRDWLNEHPFRNTPEARLICNLNNGAPIKPEALWTMMNQLKSRIARLIETSEIADDAERNKLQLWLTTKRFNPYCLRHSSISHDSDFLPDYALKKKVRWSMNSKQPSRYIKARMGNDLKQKILLQNGIISEAEGKPKPSVAECPRCNLVNCIENKCCSQCSYPLTLSIFEEIKAAEMMEVENKFAPQISEMAKEQQSLKLQVKTISETLSAFFKTSAQSTTNSKLQTDEELKRKESLEAFRKIYYNEVIVNRKRIIVGCPITDAEGNLIAGQVWEVFGKNKSIRHYDILPSQRTVRMLKEVLSSQNGDLITIDRPIIQDIRFGAKK